VNEVIEKSATLSCPEAAKLALLNPEVMEFDEVEEPLLRPGVVRLRLNTADIKWVNRPEKYFWNLRVLTIDLLQNRTLILEDRLILLGMFCQKLKEYVDSGRVKEIPALIDSYNRVMVDGAIQESLESIPAQSAIQMKLLKELADQRFPFVVRSTRYLECFAECLHGLQYTQEAKVEEIGERYAGAYADYYRPFMEEHGYILEHYLVNYVFKNLFPFDRKTVFDSYIMLVVHYALIKLILIGMSAFHKGLTPELVVKLIQSFSKTMEHNTPYLNRVLDLLHANGYDTMAWMAILIRN
ncbi:MAG: flagellin lysine-N-methylase, partial [Moorellaceae bacterium]